MVVNPVSCQKEEAKQCADPRQAQRLSCPCCVRRPLAAETFTIETSSFLGWAGAIRTDARGKDASFAILAGAKTDAD
ncbi:MAG: hypothetical protein ACOCZE_09170 [Planctomycetota bacterium]